MCGGDNTEQFGADYRGNQDASDTLPNVMQALTLACKDLVRMFSLVFVYSVTADNLRDRSGHKPDHHESRSPPQADRPQ